MTESLWGEEFNIKEDDVKKIINKTKTKKVIKEVSVDKQLKSKKVSVSDKMDLIRKDVFSILGGYEQETVTIRDIDSFKEYIDKALENKVIAVDTETNKYLRTAETLKGKVEIIVVPTNVNLIDEGGNYEAALTTQELKDYLDEYLDFKEDEEATNTEQTTTETTETTESTESTTVEG